MADDIFCACFALALWLPRLFLAVFLLLAFVFLLGNFLKDWINNWMLNRSIKKLRSWGWIVSPYWPDYSLSPSPSKEPENED